MADYNHKEGGMMCLTPAEKEQRDYEEYVEDAKRIRDPCNHCEGKKYCRTICEAKWKFIKEGKNV